MSEKAGKDRIFLTKLLKNRPSVSIGNYRIKTGIKILFLPFKIRLN